MDSRQGFESHDDSGFFDAVMKVDDE